MKHSVGDRIKVTKTGKLLRRSMGIVHAKAKKSGLVNQQKRKQRSITAADLGVFKQYLSI